MPWEIALLSNPAAGRRRGGGTAAWTWWSPTRTSEPDLVRTHSDLLAATHRCRTCHEQHRGCEVPVAVPDLFAGAAGRRLGPLPLTVSAAPSVLKVLVSIP